MTFTASPACAPLKGALFGRLRARRRDSLGETGILATGTSVLYPRSQNQVGSWFPVISLKKVPLRAGGDKVVLRVHEIALAGSDHTLPRFLGRAQRDRRPDVEATKSSPSGGMPPRSA